MGNQNAGMAKDSLEGRDVRQLDHSVSAALAQGVRYNMKILIRGQRKTGKTQLLRRLQGLGFVADYTATPEISTAHLIWTCPATDEKVKVEFWDVVDKGIQPQASWAGITANGKAVESAQEQSQQENVVLLDAETIDVYRGCDGVVLLHDPSRPETMAYSAGLLKELDADIPAIVVANFADAKAQDAGKELVAAMKKRARCVLLSACCKDGFGMDLVRDFLTVPFLAIKARYAQRELSTACEKIGTTREKLDTFGDTLNFAAHCQQWAAGGAQKAAARQAALRAAKSAAVGAAESPGDPETPKAKMVPIEKLLLPPRIDDAAPDLGKEVASFNTGGIDESFFSSDDEMAAEVQVMAYDDDEDDDDNVAGRDVVARTEDLPGSPEKGSRERGAPRGAPHDREHGLGSQARGRSAGSEDSSGSDEEEEEAEDQDEGDEEAKAELERRKEMEHKACEAKVEKDRLENMRLAALKKAQAEEERLKSELETMDVGDLDASFLSDDDDTAGEQAAAAASGRAAASASESESDADQGRTRAEDTGSSSDDSQERPMIMQDEDLSD